MTLFYDLHSVTLGIEMSTFDGDGDLRRTVALDWLLGPHGVPSAAADKPVCTITVRDVDACDMPHGQFLSEHASQYGGVVQYWRKDSDQILNAPDCAMAILKPGGGSELTIVPALSDPPWRVGEMMMLLLDHALTAQGQCLCHAATLRTPDGAGSVLLHAPSGTGKSTTAAALTQLGFKLLGDDTAALLPADEAGVVRAWGLPRGLRLHRNSVALVPAFKALTEPDGWDDQDEQMIDRKALIDAGVAAQCDPLPVAAVFALQSEDAARGQDKIASSTAFEGLRDLLSDNLITDKHGFFSGHERRLDIFSELVGKTPCFSVAICGTPQDVAGRIAGQIRKLTAGVN